MVVSLENPTIGLGLSAISDSAIFILSTVFLEMISAGLHVSTSILAMLIGIFDLKIYRKLIGIFDLKIYMDYDSEFIFILQVFPIGISNTKILHTQIYFSINFLLWKFEVKTRPWSAQPRKCLLLFLYT